jgi:hypothetical protein
VKSVATVEATFELTGGGSEATPDGVTNTRWEVKDRWVVRAEMTAQAASGFPSLHPQDAAQKQTEAERQAAADRATAGMAPMLASVEKILEVCGEDEACIERETIKMAQGIDPESAELKGARADVEKASAMPKARYQLFMPGTQSGTFSVKESMHIADRDPICMGKPQATCHTQVDVTGAGPITLKGAEKAGGSTSAEVDLEGGTLRFTIPLPYPVLARETTQTDDPGKSSGTQDAQRFLTNLRLDLGVAEACGACRTARGTKSYDVADQLSGRPAKLRVDWSFARK